MSLTGGSLISGKCAAWGTRSRRVEPIGARGVYRKLESAAETTAAVLAVVSAAAAAGPATAAAIKRLPDNPLEKLFAMMHRRARMALRRLLDLAHYRSRA